VLNEIFSVTKIRIPGDGPRVRDARSKSFRVLSGLSSAEGFRAFSYAWHVLREREPASLFQQRYKFVEFRAGVGACDHDANGMK
jgi:hypothetical protein